MRRNTAQEPDGIPAGEPVEGARRRAGMVRMPGLRPQRVLRCWTIAELSRRSGVKWPTANTADAGDEVSVETARKIMRALEACPPSAIASRLFQVGARTVPEDGEVADGRR